MKPIELRRAVKEDAAFLADMLFEALFVPPGEPPFERSVLTDPMIARYITGFPSGTQDLGIVAMIDGQPVGAVWSRLFAPDSPGYAWVDDETPELSIAILPTHQGSGIGTALLTALLAALAENGVERTSLSVDGRSRAFDLYTRLGFEQVGQTGKADTSITMVGKTG